MDVVCELNELVAFLKENGYNEVTMQSLFEMKELVAKDFPATIGKYMIKLESIKITERRALKQIPDTIGNLSELRILDLSYNWLCSLPQSIGNLSKLRMLNLGGNNLGSLPIELAQLTALEELNLFGNGCNSNNHEMTDFFPILHKLQSLNKLFLWHGGSHPDTEKYERLIREYVMKHFVAEKRFYKMSDVINYMTGLEKAQEIEEGRKKKEQEINNEEKKKEEDLAKKLFSMNYINRKVVVLKTIKDVMNTLYANEQTDLVRAVMLELTDWI